MHQRKTLASRTFAILFITSLVVMLISAVAATAASFKTYETEAEHLLLSQATTYAGSISSLDEDEMAQALAETPFFDLRCTLVGEDGTVLFDNYADPATMDNHADRAEIVAARESGQVTVMRRSEVLGKDTLYVAVLVRDGIVLRLAETRASLGGFLRGLSLQLTVSLLAIFLLSLVSSRLLTELITKPMLDIDPSDALDNDAYAELLPLLERMDDQTRMLEEQNERLERAVTLRREFAGNVSHEMKTPLQVIGGYAELLQAGVVSQEDIPRFAELIRTESNSMRSLIDDVLTLSKLDERAHEKGDPIELAGLCRRAIARLEPAADEREVTVSLVSEEPVVVAGSEALCEQMVYNLVDNAIRHGSFGGHVEVCVRKEADTVTLTVADDGPGIPADQRDRVFERFYRLDTSRSRETGGTGLGLAIVKHVAESMGGTAHVEESDAGGARFVVTMPAVEVPLP